MSAGPRCLVSLGCVLPGLRLSSRGLLPGLCSFCWSVLSAGCTTAAATAGCLCCGLVDSLGSPLFAALRFCCCCWFLLLWLVPLSSLPLLLAAVGVFPLVSARVSQLRTAAMSTGGAGFVGLALRYLCASACVQLWWLPARL